LLRKGAFHGYPSFGLALPADVAHGAFGSGPTSLRSKADIHIGSHSDTNELPPLLSPRELQKECRTIRMPD